VTGPRRIPRFLGVALLVAMAGFAAAGFLTIRRDVSDLREISQDNTLWSASQIEIELLRFRLSLEAVRRDPSPAALEAMRERFDILWSRVFVEGRVGRTLRRYDAGDGSVAALAAYLKEIDPVIVALEPGGVLRAQPIEDRLAAFQPELREYTHRVMSADAAAAGRVQARIQTSARTTAAITVAVVGLSALSLFLILLENRRQRQVAELSRRSAQEAELASRAKSRFLTMMNHELRNPLNGVLGPLALLDQSELAGRHKRLVQQAQQSGQKMLQMLTGLLDYAEMQDGRFRLRNEPFSVADLTGAVHAALAAEGAGAIVVRVLPQTPARVRGDPDRVRQIFVHLAEFVLEAREAEGVTVAFGHDGGRNLVGEIAFAVDGTLMDWKLDLLTGLTEIQPDQVATETLRPLIARGLIMATRGVLTLVDDEAARRAIRVTVPAEPVRLDQIRVHLETRSAALATIYQAALRSDRVVFDASGAGPVDVVLVDSTSVGEYPLMSRLRARFPGALFVSLGLPQAPDLFDDIVETPSDMSRLRTSILGRLAS
jgi:signal transduction histidine kinase